MSGGRPKVVVALGGNALSAPGGRGTVEEMCEQIDRAVAALWPLHRQAQLIITHGNGPQVGAELLRHEAGARQFHIPPFPLDVLVAATQGQIGYLIERQWRNRSRADGLPARIASVVTMIEVDPDDPAFDRPVKRIGPTYFDKEEAEKLAREKGWQLAEELKNGRVGWRRVVPSPRPRKVVNMDALSALTDAGFTVIAAGGGGIPVARRDGLLVPVEAVIDKDLASALLAAEWGAGRLIILTDVPYVYLHYGRPDQEALREVSLARLERLIQAGEFGRGNMLPKIQAAMQFVRQTGGSALITDFDGLSRGTGTHILP